MPQYPQYRVHIPPPGAEESANSWSHHAEAASPAASPPSAQSTYSKDQLIEEREGRKERADIRAQRGVFRSEKEKQQRVELSRDRFLGPDGFKEWIYNYPIWSKGLRGALRLTFMSYTGTVLQSVWYKVFFIAMWSLLLSILRLVQHTKFDVSLDGHAFLSPAIAFLVVFYVSNSYSRYWEGRGLLGDMLFHSRETYAKILCYAGAAEGPRRAHAEEICRRAKRYSECSLALINWAVVGYWEWGRGKSITAASKKERLEASRVELAELLRSGGWLTDGEVRAVLAMEQNQPLAPLLWLRRQVAACRELRLMDVNECVSVDNNIAEIHRVYNGMMKIASCPLPFCYAHMMRAFVWGYLLSIAPPMVATLQHGSPKTGFTTGILCMVFVSLLLFGIVQVGWELENPFDGDYNDLEPHKFAGTVHDDLEWYARERGFGAWGADPLPRDEVALGRAASFAVEELFPAAARPSPPLPPLGCEAPPAPPAAAHPPAAAPPPPGQRAASGWPPAPPAAPPHAAAPAAGRTGRSGAADRHAAYIAKRQSPQLRQGRSRSEPAPEAASPLAAPLLQKA